MYGSHHNSNAFDFESGSAHTGYTIIEADYCMDPNIEVDDLRHKLIKLNFQLRKLDGGFDCSDIIQTFKDAPPDQALVDRMRKQVERMQSDLVQFQNPFGPSDSLQAPPFRALPTANQHPFPPASSSPEIRPELGPGPATYVNSGAQAPIVQKSIGKLAPAPLKVRGRPPAQQPEIAPLPIEPPWGECQRYDSTMNPEKYEAVIRVARWIYDSIKDWPGGASKCSQPLLKAKPDAPLAGWDSYFTNGYLQFQEIKRAAQEGEFKDI